MAAKIPPTKVKPGKGSPYLSIALQMDALFSAKPIEITPPKAEFSKLPYYDFRPGKTGVEKIIINETNPYTYFSAQPAPFETRFLEPGLHLHWKFPVELSHGILHPPGTEGAGAFKHRALFPHLPDCWIVRRITHRNPLIGPVVEKSWMIESTFLRKSVPDFERERITTVPFAIDTSKNELQPFRYMGRQFEIDSITGKPIDSNIQIGTGEYYKHLTIECFGEPTFAAFYPNCKSVFGFFDPEIKNLNDFYRYELIGWYKEEFKSDEARKAIIDFSNDRLDDKDKIVEPSVGILFRSEISSSRFSADEITNATSGTIALGWTGTQALSAYLGKKIGTTPEEATKIEEQLEAIQLIGKVKGKKLDTGPLLQEAFHEKGFKPESGGELYMVVSSDVEPVPSPGKSATPIKPSAPMEITLPDAFSHHLNKVNQFMQDLHVESACLHDLESQLFADWHKYLVSCHPLPNNLFAIPSNNGIPGKLEATKEGAILSDNLNGLTSRKENEIWVDDLAEDTITIPQPGAVSDFLSKNSFRQIEIKKKIIKELALKGAADKKELDELIENYNHSSTKWKSNSDAKILLELKLSDPTSLEYKTGTADSSMGNIAWARFDGVKGYSPSLSSFSPKKYSGFSCMIHIDQNQNDAENILFSLDKNPKATISPMGVTSFWKNIYVDGELLDPFQDFHWKDLPKERWFHLYVTSFLPIDSTLKIEFFSGLKGNMASLRFWDKALSETDIFCDRNMIGLKKLELKKGPAPRYWIPNEPVVLISGDVASSVSKNELRIDNNYISNSIQNINVTAPALSPSPAEFIEVLNLPILNQKTNTHYGKINCWNPVILEWEVQNNSMKLTSQDENFNIDLITSNYHLPEDGPEFDLKRTTTDRFFSDIISGSTILSSHASQGVIKSLEKLDCGDDKELAALIDKVEDQLIDTRFLSQALDGFHDSMLMRNRSMQLDISDPLAVSSNIPFIQKVKENVGRMAFRSPIHDAAFLPILTGTVSINRLRVVDSFGRFVDINPDSNQTAYSRSMLIEEKSALISARFTQPTRMNFRWMSANHQEMEMNSHPSTSPLCGWIIPNILDRSIDVYDASGYILGIVDLTVNISINPVNPEATLLAELEKRWKPAPGNNFPVSLQQISNIHLKEVVLFTCRMQPDFLELLEKTQETIDPENFAQHTDLAMLMGKPLAIVRASLDFQLKGNPAINQDWPSFINSINYKSDRTSFGFENVKVPVRLGESGRLNDGIYGYWIDGETERNYHSILSVKKGTTIPQGIKFYDSLDPTITISATSKPVYVTMLMDPRGKAHAACGVVPVKAISIPDDQFKPALGRMSVPFFIRPLLTPGGETAIPLRNEPGYSWSWLVKEKNQWKEISTTGVVHKSVFVEAFKAGAEIWNELIKLNWIGDLGSNTAVILPRSQRTSEIPSMNILSQKNKIELILDKGFITPVNSRFVSSSATTAMEGWLKLNPTNID